MEEVGLWGTGMVPPARWYQRSLQGQRGGAHQGSPVAERPGLRSGEGGDRVRCGVLAGTLEGDACEEAGMVFWLLLGGQDLCHGDPSSLLVPAWTSDVEAVAKLITTFLELHRLESPVELSQSSDSEADGPEDQS